MSRAAAPGLLPGIQGLRALAALSVAFIHIAHDAIHNGAKPSAYLAALTKFMPWEAGVDIFFVISGFVIVHASAAFFSQPDGPLRFLRRRLTRVIPLYWIMTTVFLAIALVSRTAIHGALGGPAYLAASYLFIPWARPDGLVEPAFGLGWTLNYEMFFYVIFTPFLLLPRRLAVTAAGALLCAFTAYGQIKGFASLQLAVWSNPIILEFVAGMGIALCRAGGLRLSALARLGLFALGVAAFHFAANAPLPWRALAYGLPATALVAGVALTAKPSQARGQQVLVWLGDASYAMYLVHPFVMRGLPVLWHKIHAQNAMSGPMYVFAGLAAAQICALAINLTLERKLNLLLRRRGSRGVLNEAV